MENLIEERVEVMASEKGHTSRKTHFLKPLVTSIDGSVSNLPFRHQRHSVSSSSELKRLSSRISFSGFWFSDRYFRYWLEKMEALHEPIWRKSGIFEAIKASTYTITRNQSLFLSVAQKWCPETKSFVFPFGEATITLEDVMLLPGFSVLGSPVFAPLESSEMRDSVEKLNKASREINRRDNGGRVSQNSWISIFMGKDDEMEHEAFLVLWLSLFVFPFSSRRCISRNVFPIAVRLARGERLALAPAVLATVYRDLGVIHGFARGKCDEKVHLLSLFKLVQVWTWERFKTTRPKAKEIPIGEPRIAQWDCLQQRSDRNVRLRFKDFEWRPYTKPLKNWNPLGFYVEEAMWVTVDDSLDDEFASFARCVRVSQLAGDGFVENYYPNRVAMQFGLSQDLPGLVTRRCNFTEKEAWDDYNRPLNSLKFYMPSRLDRGYVTARYRVWWLKSVSESLSFEEVKKEPADHYDEEEDDDDDDVGASPKVLPLSKVVQKLEESFPVQRRSRTRRNLRRNYKFVHMKRAREEEEEEEESLMDEEDDNMTIAQRIRSRKKYYSDDAEETRGDGFGSVLGKSSRRRFQVMDSDDSEPCRKLASIKTEQMCKEEEDETTSKAQKTRRLCDDFEVDVNGTKETECLVHEDGEKKRCNEVEKEEDDIDESLKQRKLAIKDIELKVEARIMKMEKTLAMIREWKTRGKNEVSAFS